MKKNFYIVSIIIIIVLTIIGGLQFGGYILNDNEIKPPGNYDDWQKFDENTYISNNSDQIDDTTNYSIFNEITDKIRELNGIEKISYEIFITNNSNENVIRYYNSTLIEEGYSYNTEYSGITPEEYYELDFYTYVKGLNAVVIFLKTYKSLTWICYSTGNILDYQKIVEDNFYY
jgi:hypothetical protein